MATLLERIKRREFVVSVQIDPPEEQDLGMFRENMTQLKKAGVEIVDINAGRRVSQDSVSLAIELKRAGLDVIPHLTTRNYSTCGLREQVMIGLKSAEISDYLLIVGDPHTQLQSRASGAIGTSIIEGINKLSKLRSERHLGVSFGASVNQYRNNRDKEIKLITDKQEAGADFFMSQPVFDERQIDELLSLWHSDIRKPLLVGIWPILHAKTLSRIRERMIKGVVMSDEIYGEGRGLIDNERRFRAWGINRAGDLIDRLKKIKQVNGVYVVSPRNPSLLTNLMTRVFDIN